MDQDLTKDDFLMVKKMEKVHKMKKSFLQITIIKMPKRPVNNWTKISNS